MDIREQIIKIMTEILQDENIKIDLNSEDEWNHLNMNSIKFVRLIVEIEKKFDIEFEDEFLDYNEFSSIAQLCEYVEKRKSIEKRYT